MVPTSRFSTGRPTIARIAIATGTMCTSLLRAANTFIAIGIEIVTAIAVTIAGTGIATGAIIATGVNL